MTEYEKMIAGKIYDPMDDELDAMRNHTDKLCLRYNALPAGSPERNQIIDELFPDHGDEPYLRGPIYFDYGINTHLGNHVYANFNFVVLDVCPVYIGDFTLFGPNVSIYTALHPMVAEQRRLFYRPEQKKWVDIEYGKPIYIGKDCWFGGGVTILPGVHIGDGCVIGAGSVVTKDIPAHSLAHGSPCRVIRQITEKDRLNPELFVE